VPADFARLAEAVAAAGLVCRGGFHPGPEDGVPPRPDGAPAATVLLVGNAGPGLWAAFARERRDEPDPLDGWSRRTVEGLAERLGGWALFPFGGPPYLPFQRWARRAEPVHPSPLGALIHPEFGLWHAYRGALAFAERLDLPPRADRPSPCAACAARPCLAACPAGAVTAAGYDAPACVGHLSGAMGADCLDGGCLARRACPVGRQHAYGPEQQRFHMAAFLAANRR
jgi:hypothetical protein